MLSCDSPDCDCAVARRAPSLLLRGALSTPCAIVFSVSWLSGAVVPRCTDGRALALEALIVAAATVSIDSEEGRGLCFREGDRANLENMLFDVAEGGAPSVRSLNSAITSAVAIVGWAGLRDPTASCAAKGKVGVG